MYCWLSNLSRGSGYYSAKWFVDTWQPATSRETKTWSRQTDSSPDTIISVVYTCQTIQCQVYVCLATDSRQWLAAATIQCYSVPAIKYLTCFLAVLVNIRLSVSERGMQSPGVPFAGVWSEHASQNLSWFEARGGRDFLHYQKCPVLSSRWEC